MSNYTVKFHEVGRARISWEATFTRRPDEVDIIKAVQKKRCLASRNIEADFIDDNEMSGDIIAGFRTVGTFTVQAPSHA